MITFILVYFCNVLHKGVKKVKQNNKNLFPANVSGSHGSKVVESVTDFPPMPET